MKGKAKYRSFSKDQEQNDKARCESKAADTAMRAQAIGDLRGVSALLTKLVSIRGDGGPDNAKKMMFADNCSNSVERSQRVAAHGMRGLREDVRDTEE